MLKRIIENIFYLIVLIAFIGIGILLFIFWEDE